MARWMKVGTDLVVGGAAGSVSKLCEDWDADREVKEGKKLALLAKGSTYVDYGIPLLSLVGSLVGFLKGDWETRALSIGGTLAGRRVTAQVKARTSAWVPVSVTHSPMQSPMRLPAPTGMPAPTFTMPRTSAWVPRAIS